MPRITLQSSDHGTFFISEKAAMMSRSLTAMLNDLGVDESTEVVPINLPNIRSKILKLVIEWMTHHKDNPPGNTGTMKSNDISQWDRKFLNVEKIGVRTVFEIILAANYLDIQPLIDIASFVIADMIKDKQPEEIRKAFKPKREASSPTEPIASTSMQY